MPSAPLRDLFRSEKPDLVTHEIILVHGFKSCSGSKSRSPECRRILKSWVANEIKPIRNCVNVRTFSFDSAHILHNGRSALHESTLELSNSIAATQDPTSPLFCSTSNGDHGRSSRAAIFIAHGMGIWVVKELLTLISSQVNRIDPTGLFFFDIPEALMAPNPVVNISTRLVISPYLHEFSETFKIELNQAKLPGLQAKIEDIDVNFQNLAMARYGRCEAIGGQNSVGTSYTTRAMCHNIWMSSTPALTFEKPTVKDFARQAGCLLKGCRPNTETPIQKLADLGLGEELSAAISSRGFYDPRQELIPLDQIPVITLDPPEATDCPKKSSSGNPSISSTNPTNDSTGGPENSDSESGSKTTIKHSCCHEKQESSGDEESPCHGSGKSDPVKAGSSSSEPTDNPTCSPEKSGQTETSTVPDNSCNSKDEGPDDGSEAPSSPKSDAVIANTVVDNCPHCIKKEKLATAEESNCDSKKEDIVDTKTSGPDCGTVKGKEKERLDSPRMSPLSLPEAAIPMPENVKDDKGEHDARRSLPDDYKVDDEFDFDNIITQRNRAAAEDDEEALHSSIQKLEVLKFHQKENLENDDPRILITQREIVKTSIEYGWWNGTIMKNWAKNDIFEMEDLVRKAYDGLRQSLGPHHRETMEALALLFALGVPMLEVDELPVADIQAIQSMVRQKRMANYEETRQPGKLLRVLGLEYKAAHKRVARP
ncbi:uncharacterized protein F4807DRAFT_469812 [Annulohypoxylon truncatum]|uniref:uncharacterized protein n=1 Tax=Annulohypoxylon truncatum TaxID=327061 RepID=UPI002008A9E6|nr:uncharacterized protein F4807DRAFT_469812 [Annulohypoxylon truncatum]KAI1207070.1 hypothetical protein F4807DRAFT_469812 [Annulohypoxylon truncatum]